MNGTEAPLFLLVAGAALLLAGRRLFWLFVGLVGFLTVYRWMVPHGVAPPVRLVVAIFAGLLGIFLAVVVQKLAVAVAGFLVGGWAAAQFLGLHMQHPGGIDLAVFVVAGIIAALLAVKVFDFALVLLSSLAGAGLIVDALHLSRGTRPLAAVALIVVGIAVQLGLTGRRRSA